MDDESSLASRLKEELFAGQRTFNGFSDDALYLQKFLHDESWTRESWDEVSREIYSEDIKPQLAALLSDCSNAMSGVTGEDFSYELARPNPNSNVAKWFWGAVVPRGKTLHNHIQLFVALRWGYVRVGLYINDQNRERFDKAIHGLEENEIEVNSTLESAKEAGVVLCEKIPDTSRGTVISFEKSEETWAKEFAKRKEIDLLKGWEINDDDLRVSEFSEDVLEVFAVVYPLYEILR